MVYYTIISSRYIMLCYAMLYYGISCYSYNEYARIAKMTIRKHMIFNEILHARRMRELN